MRKRWSTVQGIYILAAALVLPAGVANAQRRGAHPPHHAPESAFDDKALATQVALDRAGFSPGEIDGQGGTKTKLALAAFQAAANRPLDVASDPITTYTITEQDVAGPFIESLPRDMMDQAKLPALGYTSAVEALAEKFHSSPNLLRHLNPSASFKAGESIKVPNVDPFELPSKTADKPAAGRAARGRAAAPAPADKPAAGSVEVLLSAETKSLTVRDSTGKTLMYAPVTTGSEHDPLPIGEWKVVGVSWNPVFNYNPDLFWDADQSTQSKAKIAAGPNNPVGVVWVDINKPHFGLHGTPEPSTIGQTESHGCVRLTNWDATRLGRLVAPGTKVIIK